MIEANFEVLMTVHSLDPKTGGPARSVPSLCRNISDNGYKTQIFVQDYSTRNYSAKALNYTDESTFNLPSVKPINLLKSCADSRVKRKKGSTIIHNHGIWLPINHYASVTANKHKIPLILSPRGMLEPWALGYKSFKKKIAWSLYQQKDMHRASLLHATSEQEEKSIRELNFSGPVAVIPNGVNLPNIISDSVQESAQSHTALFLSRIHPKKGLINLVKAWSKVSPGGWKVIIAGPSENNHDLEVKQEVDRLGLQEIFTFIGEVNDEDKWALYGVADLFILPTYSENFGIVVAEALASGLPVITTKGAPWEDLITRKCGWWTDIGVYPLADAISAAINLSREERLVMGVRGRNLVADKYAWPKIANKMIRTYEWVLNGGGTPSWVST